MHDKRRHIPSCINRRYRPYTEELRMHLVYTRANGRDSTKCSTITICVRDSCWTTWGIFVTPNFTVLQWWYPGVFVLIAQRVTSLPCMIRSAIIYVSRHESRHMTGCIMWLNTRKLIFIEGSCTSMTSIKVPTIVCSSVYSHDNPDWLITRHNHNIYALTFSKLVSWKISMENTRTWMRSSRVLTHLSAATSTLMAQRPMARTDLRTKSTSTSVAYLKEGANI